MKLKPSFCLFIATAAASGLAYSDVSLMQNDQGDVEMYGTLDAAVVHQTHSLSISPSTPNQIYPYQATTTGIGSVNGLVGGGLSDSRIGFKGAFNLDDGAKAIFNLETGFDLTSGQINNAAESIAANPKKNSAGASVQANSVNADSSLNGQLFGRAAWFGFQDPTWGKLTMGLQNNPMKDVFAKYDPVKSDSFSPFGESGTVGGGGGLSEDARMQNSVEYTASAGGFDASLAYQFGNNSSNNGILGGSGVGSGAALRVGYETDMFGIQAVYNKFTNALKATNTAIPGYDIALQEMNTHSALVAAKFTGVKDLNLEAGWEEYKDSSPSDLANIQAIWGQTVSGVTAAYANGTSQTTHIYFAGGDYNFTNKLNLALGYYDTKADNTTYTTGTDSDIKTVSSVLKFQLYKRTDVYLAATTNKFGGSKYSTGYNKTQDAFGVGARLKF